jgi:hypothetical protein
MGLYYCRGVYECGTLLVDQSCNVYDSKSCKWQWRMKVFALLFLHMCLFLVSSMLCVCVIFFPTFTISIVVSNHCSNWVICISVTTQGPSDKLCIFLISWFEYKVVIVLHWISILSTFAWESFPFKKKWKMEKQFPCMDFWEWLFKD